MGIFASAGAMPIQKILVLDLKCQSIASGLGSDCGLESAHGPFHAAGLAVEKPDSENPSSCFLDPFNSGQALYGAKGRFSKHLPTHKPESEKG